MMTESKQNEFWFHVSPQEDIPVAGIVNDFLDPVPLTAIIEEFQGEEITDTRIKEIIGMDVDKIDLLRALVGVADKRMYLDLSYIFYKTRYREKETQNILGTDFCTVNSHPLDFFKRKIICSDPVLADKSLNLIANYLVEKGIIPVLTSLCLIGSENAVILIDKLVNSKEAQQKITKRRGHGIEQRLAMLLNEIGISYLPQNKHRNPMDRDPNVLRGSFRISPRKQNETWAFDLIVLQENRHLAYVQSLIHTSDPGQYGVNKSDETVSIKEDLTIFNRANGDHRELWGLVDGVGFAENKSNTIDKMLEEFDTFIQLKSIYKAALRCHALGLVNIKAVKYDNTFYTRDQAEEMHGKYGSAEIEFYYDVPPKNELYHKVAEGGAALIYL